MFTKTLDAKFARSPLHEQLRYSEHATVLASVLLWSGWHKLMLPRTIVTAEKVYAASMCVLAWIGFHFSTNLELAISLQQGIHLHYSIGCPLADWETGGGNILESIH